MTKRLLQKQPFCLHKLEQSDGLIFRQSVNWPSLNGTSQGMPGSGRGGLGMGFGCGWPGRGGSGDLRPGFGCGCPGLDGSGPGFGRGGSGLGSSGGLEPGLD